MHLVPVSVKTNSFEVIQTKMNKTKKKQSNTITDYMSPSLLQKIYTDRLEEKFKLVQIENEEKSKKKQSNQEEESAKVDERSLNLEKQLAELKEQCKQKEENLKICKDNKLMKSLLNEARAINLQKHIQIRNLQAQLNVQTYTEAGELKNLFIQFECHFMPDEMKQLRSIDTPLYRNDSTFVSKCIFYLYGGPQNIENRLPTGAKTAAGKQPLSPEKVDVASKMLRERLISEGLSADVMTRREARFNRLLSNAVSTARKKATTETPNPGRKSMINVMF